MHEVKKGISKIKIRETLTNLKLDKPFNYLLN